MSKNFELLQQGHEQDLFRTSDSPAEPWVTVVAPPVADLRKQRPPEAKVLSLPVQWLGNLGEGVRRWRQRVQMRTNHRGPDPEAMASEEAIKLVQRVFRTANGSAPQAVAFAGVEANHGCATVCARVGEILAAQVPGPVCMVDANFQSPSLHQYFGIDNHKGLVDAVLEDGPIQEYVHRLSEGNLYVMPSGRGRGHLSVSPAEERLDHRMKELRSVFHRVVIHSSPLSVAGDSLPLSRWTDGVVLVLEAHSTRREAARRAKESLEMADVRMLGVVLNNRTFPIPESLYRRL